MLDIFEEISRNPYVLRVDEWYLPRLLKYVNASAHSDNPGPYNLTDAGLLRESEYVDAVEWWMDNDWLATEVIPLPYIEPGWAVEDGYEEVRLFDNPGVDDGDGEDGDGGVVGDGVSGDGGGRRQFRTYVKITLHELRDTQDYINFIEGLNDIMERTGTELTKSCSLAFHGTDEEQEAEAEETGFNLSCNSKNTKLTLYGIGEAFQMFEQYLSLSKYFWEVAFTVLIVIFAATLVGTGSVVHAGLMTWIIVIMITELIGVMGWLGMKVSALPMVTTLSCIGVSVEFVGHVTRSFAGSDVGSEAMSGRSRLSQAILTLGLPIIDGTISTLLAVSFLARSDFGFVRKYFFMPYIIIAVVGVFTGLGSFPVFLMKIHDLLLKYPKVHEISERNYKVYYGTLAVCGVVLIVLKYVLFVEE